MSENITCLVTIHGIGFQQPPSSDHPGYADSLHNHLHTALNQNGANLLSDDPNRQDYQTAGPSAPIYVQSIWPVPSPEQTDASQPPSSWDTTDYRTIMPTNTTETQLVKDGASIAHIALVYSGLEGKDLELEESLKTLFGAMTSYQQQGRLDSQLDMFLQEIVQPYLQQLSWKDIFFGSVTESSSLHIRQDAGSPYNNDSSLDSRRPGDLLIQLGNDVAAYVNYNGLRQRIQSFIREALLRLAFRNDVSSIVLNTHSNGTVIGLDVLQELPPIAVKKIQTIITAGSPLRKYVDIWKWGEYMTTVPNIKHWFNFWDQADYIADPLRPDAGWHRDQQVEITDDQLKGNGIYPILKPDGSIMAMPIQDIKVDNLTNSLPTGLKAHNYWDNTTEVISQVATILRSEIKR